MSVIENPVAYLNETTSVDVQTANVTEQGSENVPTNPNKMLDETPLTTDKNKSRSPKQLNQTDTTTDKIPVSDLPDHSLSSQLGHSEHSEQQVSESSSRADKTDNETSEKTNSAKHNTSEITEGSENKASEQGSNGRRGNAEGEVNFLALAENMESDEEDEEYVPGGDHKEEEEEEEEKGGEEEITPRLYSLRDGVKGTAVEEVKEVPHDESDKKKADDLWSMFKADVADLPIRRLRSEEEAESSVVERTYDFAGESVTVKEEAVKMKSKRRSIVSTLGLDRKRRRESAPILSPSQKESGEPAHSHIRTDGEGVESGSKRARPVSKLNSLVNRLTKRPKMTVLNKTALDWEQYKEGNKISDDVKNEAKAEGYLEKQDFLNRADQKQFELEREIRAQQARRRQMMGSKQF